MSIINSARADGFTHVETMAGPLPLEQFHLRDAIGMQYSAEHRCIFGPTRPANEVEIAIWEGRGNPPMIGMQARDIWRLT